MKILIKNVDIITSNRKNMLIRNGFIAVDEGKISILTTDEAKLSGFTPDKIISGNRMIAMPGLVNAHTHSPMTVLRNYADDLALEEWLFHHIFPAEAKLTEEDVYWGSVLGIAEMLRSGTTAFADMYYFVHQTARAVEESGIRATLSLSPCPFEFGPGGATFFDKTADFAAFYKAANGSCNGRLKVYALVHSPYIYDFQHLSLSAACAKEIGTGIHIHILETAKEREDTTAKYGKDGGMACLEAGIYDVPTIAAHCVHVSEENIRTFAQKGVSVAHNPTSNLKLGSGIAPVPPMLEKGVNIALGTDGTASNNNLNMFEEINLAALLHKGVGMNPTLVDAAEAIIMGTANGAKAIGFGEEVGELAVGKKADLILINADKIHFTPYHNPVSAIAYSVEAADVDTVMVDGKILLEKGEHLTIDVEKAKWQVARIAQKFTGA